MATIKIDRRHCKINKYPPGINRAPSMQPELQFLLFCFNKQTNKQANNNELLALHGEQSCVNVHTERGMEKGMLLLDMILKGLIDLNPSTENYTWSSALER